MPSEVTLFTTSEVAHKAGVDSSTVRRWVDKKQIKPAITTPGGHHRFTAEEVARVLHAQPAEDIPA